MNPTHARRAREARAAARPAAGKPGTPSPVKRNDKSRPSRRRPVSRISISLPEDLLSDLDQMVAARQFETRSQAVNDMLHQFLMEHRSEIGDDVMVGTIALFYKNDMRGLQMQLADLQAFYIDEVISSLHVHLQNNQTMEVILVQGPARKLQKIADEMTSRRGVVSGKMHLVAALMPQLHPFIDEKGKEAKGAAI
jgi:CopG family nickel-responsive transcriptional regulator